MKIMFLTRTLSIGGAERQLVELAKGLHRTGHTVIVAAVYAGGSLTAELLKSGVAVHVLGKKGRWDVFGFIGRLIRYTRNAKPDILHGYHVVPNLLTLLCKPFLRGTKIIWGVRSSDVDLEKYDWLARLTFKASCILSRFSDWIVVNSNRGKSYHQSCGYPQEKMVVIYNGIDTKRFKPDQDARIRIRQEWCIAPETKLIGLVARLDPMKDHPIFLRAAKILADLIQDVRFVCVGSGTDEYRDSLVRMCEEYGLNERLTWINERMDMPAVYNALDVVTSCSVTEGFSNVIAEAMSCGIPCVVTDVGDSAMIVGKTGFVVPVKSPAELADGWINCLDKYKTIPDLSVREKITSEFSLEELVGNSAIELKRMNGCTTS